VSLERLSADVYDYHVHSNYSDGAFLRWMVNAAAEAGLAGVGFADHCNVLPTPEAERYKRAFGFNLDLTYHRRREAIEAVRADAEVAVFDAVEMDYHPDHEAVIDEFLEEATFDYAVGSVHDLDGENVHFRAHFADMSEARRRELVDRYVEKLLALIDSELFEIAAHVDLIERNPHLRGFMTADEYGRIADAFERSRTVPEINAGRLFDDYGTIHPAPDFLDALVDRGIEFTVGSDSHDPKAITDRTPALEREFEMRGIVPGEIHSAVTN